MTARDLTVELSHLELAAREWGAADAPPVLALHGWLDNAASFDRLAPLLPDHHLVALDLAGHGRSQHRHPSVVHHFIDWAPEVVAAADALGWKSFSLIGHSMGAGISTLIAGTFPDRLQKLVLLEGAGPLAADASRAPEQLASALEDEARAATASPRVFPDLRTAVEARLRDSDLDTESAKLLVERGSEPVEGGIRFTHDPRLRTRSRTRLTENQVLAFLSAITCPVLAVRALQGWPFPMDVVKGRLETIQRLETAEIEGGHHVHLTHPERVAPLINEFLTD
jgi:pimeloyl-ACP methyl ester carboxylesterase